MNRIRLWPHGILMILGVAVVAGAGAALWFHYERTAQASSLPNAARIERVDGQVGVNRSLDNETNSQWVAARANTPVSVGDRIYTKDDSRTAIAFTGRNAATVDPNTSIDILDLSQDRTQLALRSGSASFDIGSISSGQLFEVATPCGAIDLKEPGLYQLAIDQTGNATATAFSGSAEVVGQAGSGAIHKGEVLTVPCQGGSSATISRVNYDQAGTYLDNHFRYRYPRKYDGRYHNYYTYLDNPNYYDPYQTDNSYHYVSDYIPGVDDLDDYGDWRYVNDYGYAWSPRVQAGWAPYQSGYWETDYPYGVTWVSNEPWGYAPYHYGRWAYASNSWVWVPDSTNTYPSYSPALTAFVPLGNSTVAWFALGPGDPYVPRYYDTSWQPVYLSSPAVTERFVNINVPGAITAIPAQNFGQVVYSSDIVQVDPRTIAQVRPVLDPLTADPLRQVAFASRRVEPRIDISPAVAQRLNSTPVIAADPPPGRVFRRDLASAMRVQPISGGARRQQLQLRDERAATGPQSQPQAPNVAAEQAKEKQMADLARQAARGDRGARQQMQELRQQQIQQGRVEGTASQQAQGQQVGQPAQNQRQVLRQQQQAQREAARQQMINNQQLRRAGVQGEARTAQTEKVQRSAQPQVVRPQVTRSEPQRGRKSEIQMQRPQNQPRVMSAPRPQPVLRQPQARPQMERRGPPAEIKPQVQAAPRAQPQPQPQMQRQAPPRAQAQPQAQPKAQGGGKGQGKPKKP